MANVSITELDGIGGEIHLTARAVQYIFERLTELTERDLDQIEQRHRELNLISTYNEVQELALILGEYAQKLRKEETALDAAIDAIAKNTQ